MAKTTVSDTNCSSQYIVLIMNWIESGAHWVRGFKTLAEARSAVQKKYAEHNAISNRVVIIRGEIEQLGVNLDTAIKGE